MNDFYEQPAYGDAGVAEAEGREMMLSDAVVESLRYMGSFSQRSLKYFDMTPSSTRYVAKRAAPVENMLISRVDFRNDVMREYNRVPVGQMRQVVAATGVGKSTTFPCEICNVTGQNGLILSPRADLSYFNGAYLAERFAVDNYPNVTPLQLRSEHATHPAQGKILYYDLSASFFMMLVIYPDLLTTLGIKFILFDESHETTGDYKLAELLSTAGLFSTVKVLLVSATRGDTSMEHETAESQRRLVPVKPTDVDLGSVESLTATSPLHYSRMNTRTVVFVPDLKDIGVACAYYERYDIPVFVHTSASSSKGMTGLAQFLGENSVCVVLTDRVLETGFTYQFTNCIDCGFTQDMVIDVDRRAVSLVKRPVTMSERKQRCGRVGRITAGIAYFADLESTPEPKGLPASSACYLALWCRVYNLTTNLPEVTFFKEFFGEMTHRKAMMLLHSYVHPVLAHSYMNMQGQMCHGWEKVFKYAIRKTGIENSDDDVDESTMDWVFQNVYDERFVEKLEKIKVPMSVPDEWVAFFYAVWQATTIDGKRWGLGDGSDRRSVLSVAPADKVKRSGWHNPRAIRDSTATLSHASLGRRGTFARALAIPEDTVPDMPTFSKALPLRGASVINASGSKRAAVRLDTTAAVASQVDAGSSTPREVRVSRLSSPVSGSALTGYKPVRATTLHLEKVYPYDSALMKAYKADPRRRQKDFEKVEGMKKFESKIHGMDSAERGKSVLAVVRCWNYSVVGAVQVQAGDLRPSSFFSRSSSLSRVASELDRSLDGYRTLMVAMELEGVVFAVEKTGRHNPDPVRVDSSTLVNDRLDYVASCMVSLTVDGQDRGMYLRDEGCLLSALHVFELNGKIDRPSDVTSMRIAKTEDLLLMFSDEAATSGIMALVRSPVDGEAVYLLVVKKRLKIEAVTGVSVMQVANRWFHSAVGKPGYSGAPILAVSDGKLLGFHLGASTVFSGYPSMMTLISGLV